MEKGRLFVLCGLPGSGKSTASKNYGQVFSSDGIREELFGDENLQYDERLSRKYLKKKGQSLEGLSASEKEQALINAGHAMVFGLLNHRVKEALKQGQNVVYDATSLRRKERKKILKTFRPYFETASCIFVNTPLETCLAQNACRDRQVPESVIKDMSRRLQAPVMEEGWDEIIEITPENRQSA